MAPTKAVGRHMVGTAAAACALRVVVEVAIAATMPGSRVFVKTRREPGAARRRRLIVVSGVEGALKSVVIPGDRASTKTSR
jgi:hypothetical protein